MSKYVKGYSASEIEQMKRSNTINKCLMCGRWWFKEEKPTFPYYNIKTCDECKQVKLNGKGKGKKNE